MVRNGRGKGKENVDENGLTNHTANYLIENQIIDSDDVMIV
jgi:hypothetical protein